MIHSWRTGRLARGKTEWRSVGLLVTGTKPGICRKKATGWAGNA